MGPQLRYFYHQTPLLNNSNALWQSAQPPVHDISIGPSSWSATSLMDSVLVLVPGWALKYCLDYSAKKYILLTAMALTLTLILAFTQITLIVPDADHSRTSWMVRRVIFRYWLLPRIPAGTISPAAHILEIIHASFLYARGLNLRLKAPSIRFLI